MKQVKAKFLIPIALVGGTIGAILMKALYSTGMDHKGLLVRSHPAYAGIWILAGAMTLILLLCCRNRGNVLGWERNFPRSVAGGLLCLPLAVVFAASRSQSLFAPAQALDLVANAASVLCGPALAYSGICRIYGKKPHYLAFCLVCVCFGIRLVSHYRTWSSDPQLMDYVFFQLSHVCLMLCAYRLAHCAAGGDCRKLTFPALMGCFFSLMCLPNCPDPLFMGACALWTLGCLPGEEG